MIRKISLFFAISFLVILGISCSTSTVINTQVAALRKDLNTAIEKGSKKCAPMETAIAEASLRFAEDESSEGNSVLADKHIADAKTYTAKALEIVNKNPELCMPVKVLVKEPPKPVIIAKKEIDLCKIDSDNDGLMDCEDKCPNDYGTVEFNGCPPPDRDGDGITDDKDKCPDIPGLPQFEGCPDTDGDGIVDGQDKCPTVPGVLACQGCPDSDKDGICDPNDKCPQEAGIAEEQGCPRKYTLVVINRESKQIEIKQQVHFATGKAKILKDSYELLRQVAQVLKDNPEFKVEVQGHTDNVGGRAYNMKLSQARANAVRDHLIKVEGIDPDRLIAKGYGFDVPIASNKTEKGRALNRRVEFHVISGMDDNK
ncbi:MAG: OmpA family protein [Deltaproteobacteria bacterium]|nr:OmpA family protein [Deltaproteobacteria bacterium]